MKRMFFRLSLYCMMVLPTSLLLAQTGKWEGTLTYNLDSETGDQVSISLTVMGKEVSGRCTVVRRDGHISYSVLKGYKYSDRSMTFYELPSELRSETVDSTGMRRKFQVLYQRSVFDNTLEGFWQEIFQRPFDRRRRMGRLIMRQVNKSGA